MVEFLSFFFFLVTGSKPVELTVTPPVVRVEALLDGQQIATLTGRPWVFTCELGAEPRPRELIVIGYDAEGREVDRAVQWVNLGVQSARSRMSFEEDRKGNIRWIGLSWEIIGQREPESIAVTFDGEPVLVEDPRRIRLPSYDPASVHFVTATLRFSDSEVSRLDASFGGLYGEEVSTELTALPVVLAPKARMPALETLATWFVKDGRPLEVQGVEKGRADMVVVRDPAAQRRLERLAEMTIARNRGPESLSAVRRSRRPPRRRPGKLAIPGDVAFSSKTDLRFVGPFAVPLYARDDVTRDLFSRSGRHGVEESGLLWLTHRVKPRGFPFELAEAVAVAGMMAHGSGRRRAVLVILDAETEDPSDFSPAAVRDYLHRLRVPLYVWSTARGLETEWGEARYVGDDAEQPGSPSALSAAVRDLDRDLQRQRVVWLKGRHLPEDVELSPEADGRLSLAGLEPRSPGPQTSSREAADAEAVGGLP